MEFTAKQRTITSMMRDVNKKVYNLNHQLQRKEGQWSPKAKKELIDSILHSYPIDPIRCVQEDGKKFILDGIQRTTDIRDFLDDKFALDAGARKVVIGDVEYEIANKKFSQLDEELQERIKSYELTVYTFTDCSYEDYCIIFRRQNNGKPLSTTQKRTTHESEEMANLLKELISHKALTKLMTPAQIRSDYDKDVIRQVLMFISSYEVTSLKATELDKFSRFFSENYDATTIEALKKALDTLDEILSEKVKLSKLSIPIVIYGMHLTLTLNKDIKKYTKWINDFIANYDTNEDFLQYCKTGTSNSDNVLGRLRYIETAIKKL